MEEEVQVEVPAEEIQAEAPADTEPKTDETAEVVEPPKPKKSAQERIDELTRKRREAERDAEYWRTKALEKETPQATPVTPSGRPTLDQFETTQEYEDKLFEWYEQKKEVTSAGRKREAELSSAYRTYEERADKARAEFEDFDEAVSQTPYTETMKVALWKNEHGPELAYHIATHPKDGERIRNLAPDEQLIELGRLETKLLLAKQTKKVSEAPKPISPVGMGGGGKQKDPSEMSDDEWFKWNEKQEYEKLKKKLGG
jgi:hypothetical protein